MHTMKHSAFLMERYRDRNQITHPHFPIFIPVGPGHLYFHSIWGCRMTQSILTAVN